MVTNLDILINSNIAHLQNPVLNKVMIFITNIVSPSALLVLSSLLFAILIQRKKRNYSLLLLFSLIGGLLIELLIKLLVQRARPENALLEVSGYSFPSGHATIAIIFFSLVIYSFKDDIKNKALKYVFIIGNVILFLLIGLSRIYLNVHWFSDVIAGFLLGLIWLVLLIFAFKIQLLYKKRKDSSMKIFS